MRISGKIIYKDGIIVEGIYARDSLIKLHKLTDKEKIVELIDGDDYKATINGNECYIGGVKIIATHVECHGQGKITYPLNKQNIINGETFHGFFVWLLGLGQLDRAACEGCRFGRAISRFQASSLH